MWSGRRAVFRWMVVFVEKLVHGSDVLVDIGLVFYTHVLSINKIKYNTTLSKRIRKLV